MKEELQTAQEWNAPKIIELDLNETAGGNFNSTYESAWVRAQS